MPNILVGNADFKDTRNPGLAPLLSLLPGLGQIYNGQARKGLLFLATSTSYLFVFALMAFNQNLIDGLNSFGQTVHMSLNPGLMSILSELHLGSTLSFIVIGLFAGFVICAMQDAYKHAIFLQQKHIYADSAMEINEAASGSYLLHFIGIVFLFILTVFFFKQSPTPHTTYIEFFSSQLPTKKIVDSQYKSDRASDTSGIHKSKPIAPSSSKEPTPKTLQQPRGAVVPMPKFHPVVVNNKTPLLPSAQQKSIVNPTLPVPHNVGTPNAVVPPLLPQSINKTIDSPQPSFANKVKASQTLVLPKASNDGSINTGLIDKAPAPVNNASGTSRFAPNPEIMKSGTSAQNSTNNGLPNIGPTRATNSSQLMPGVRIKPATGSPIVVPTFGTPKGIAGDNAPGNPLENTNTQGPDSLPAAPINFGPYMNDLQRRIKQNWFPPKDTADRKIVVVFKIHKHGELTDLRLEKSSGLSNADQAALKAVENAAPFRSLPAGAAENIDVQFTFDYNVFNGGNGIFRKF